MPSDGLSDSPSDKPSWSPSFVLSIDPSYQQSAIPSSILSFIVLSGIPNRKLRLLPSFRPCAVISSLPSLWSIATSNRLQSIALFVVPSDAPLLTPSEGPRS